MHAWPAVVCCENSEGFRLCVLLVSSLLGPKGFVDDDMIDSAWCTVCVDYSISASKRCLARQSLSCTDFAGIG
jgi:hypothetical protein